MLTSLHFYRRYLLKSAVVTPRKKWLHQHATKKRHMGDIYELQRRGTPAEPPLPSWITTSMLHTKKYLLQSSVSVYILLVSSFIICIVGTLSQCDGLVNVARDDMFVTKLVSFFARRFTDFDRSASWYLQCTYVYI